MEKYNPEKIESKWQKIWEEKKIYKAEDESKKPKKYILIEFPYPSGAGLHVGHCRPYCALDALARKKKMEGNNVLFPIGWDAFGLPTENFAIKNKIHPQEATEKNIANFKKQIKSLGLSFGWSREINTTDPKYYKWTQWIFLKLFEKGLAYQTEMPINWCPSCKIGLANEEVVDGKCERCGAQTEKKIKKQWMLKITAYADKLIEGLKKVDYPERVKAQQINWIGESCGAEIKFNIVIKNEGDTEKSQAPSVGDFRHSVPGISIFTTRPDTLFGCTYMVVCPEHKIISNLKSYIVNFDEVKKYLKEVKKKSDLERTDLAKEKTGIELKGIKAINPVNNKEIPIFVADYVLPHYGTGAIMAVPAHDERDFEFAKKYDLPIKKVIEAPELQSIVHNAQDIAMGAQTNLKVETECYIEDGINVNSDFLDGLETKKAKEKIIKWLEEKGVGRKAINYKLRDWIFSRQHYWGEPIPLVHCKKCGIVPIPEKDLPVELPYVEKYQPTKTGESPLTNISKWVNIKCPKCGGPAKRETDTMPNWAGSSWYYLRYLDPQNDKALADFEKIKYWMPVDFYNGGMEHTTLHLLYSRFWHKFLFDIGVVLQDEPYKKRTSHGMVLAEDGRKMSKSFGNVINPDDAVKKFGADSLRLYEMFMGPFEQTISWNTDGLVGMRRFLEKVYKLSQKSKIQTISNYSKSNPKSKCQNNSKFKIQNSKLDRLLHQTIKKVTEDIDNFKFNTAIAQLMILLNEMERWQNKGDTTSCRFQELTNTYLIFLKLLSPFAPHICEELYQRTKNRKQRTEFKSIFEEEWPKYNPELIKEEKINLIIQINGKVRDQIEVDTEISEDKAKKIALSQEKVVKWIKGNKVKKVIFVKGKLINIVV